MSTWVSFHTAEKSETMSSHEWISEHSSHFAFYYSYNSLGTSAFFRKGIF